MSTPVAAGVSAEARRPEKNLLTNGDSRAVAAGSREVATGRSAREGLGTPRWENARPCKGWLSESSGENAFTVSVGAPSTGLWPWRPSDPACGGQQARKGALPLSRVAAWEMPAYPAPPSLTGREQSVDPQPP